MAAIVVTENAANDVSLRSLDLKPVGVADRLELCNGKLFEISEVIIVWAVNVDLLDIAE